MYATIGGGLSNTSSGCNSTISGGRNNTASGNCSTVSGGQYNIVCGTHSAVLGGWCNVMTCNTSGAFGSNITSVADNTFHVNKLWVGSLPLGVAGLSSGMLYYENTTCTVRYVP